MSSAAVESTSNKKIVCCKHVVCFYRPSCSFCPWCTHARRIALPKTRKMRHVDFVCVEGMHVSTFPRHEQPQVLRWTVGSSPRAQLAAFIGLSCPL